MLVPAGRLGRASGRPADAAFVGTVLDARVSGDRSTYLFRVEQVKGDDREPRRGRDARRAGRRAASSSRSATGVGLLLTRDGDGWRSSLCSQVDRPTFLRDANVEDNALPPVNWGGSSSACSSSARVLFFLVRKSRGYRRLR